MNCRQLRDYVVAPTLTALGCNSPGAVNLILGTCAQESHMGTYILQVNLGFDGGIGIYQMEERTFDSLWFRMIDSHPSMKKCIQLLLGYSVKPPASRMASDLLLSTAMTRLHYLAINAALPKADDIVGLANYWKKYYNTIKGRGTVEQFVANYEKYVT